MRKTIFSTEEYYHIYNRGVDKREIFIDPEDLGRFIQSMEEFNSIEIFGGIYANSFHKKEKLRSSTSKLVEFVAYCLNQNHYHFILRPLVNDGVQKFMHKLSTGYTKYFNDKHKRSGVLFQGRYKAIHIETNEYLLHLSAYVNCNNKVHKGLNKQWMNRLPFSSFDQYKKERGGERVFCNTKVVLGQFKSRKEYVSYCEKVLPQILKRKEQEKIVAQLIIET